MSIKTFENFRVTKTNFSEIFDYAEKKFGINWNECNDLFFNSETLSYGSYNEFDLLDDDQGADFEDLAVSLKDIKDDDVKNISDDNDRSNYIIWRFMKDNNMTYMFVDNK